MLFDEFFPQMENKLVCIELTDGKYFTGKLIHLDMHYNAILTDLTFKPD